MIAHILRRPISVLVAVAAILCGSYLAIRNMPRDIFPPLGVPTIYVAQPYGGMDASQMESYLTYFYEYHFLYIANLKHVESKTIQGASIMKLEFHPNTDMSAAMAETISYVNRARAFMPAGAPNPFVTRFDAGSVPVGYLTFSTENPNRTLGQMQDEALNKVRPLFATLPGVSAPPPFGGSARTIVVNVDADKLRARGLSPDEVVQTIAKSNVVSPSGNMILGDLYPIVPMNTVVGKPAELADVPIRSAADGAVYVRDVATVTDGSDITTSFALVNGRRTVYLPVTKRSEASTLAVVEQVKSNIPKFQSAVSEDVKVSYEFDQSPVVWSSINSLVKEAGLGAILTGLMVLLFLRDLRSAFIVVVNIPLSLLAASLAMWLTGQTVNLMTLGGLALAVGILVDEATVAVENIHARMARGALVGRASADAIKETALPRLLAMLCILAMFIPAFFMEGAARALFQPLAWAVGFSMIASYLLSSSLVPVLAIWLLRGRKAHEEKPFFLARWYEAWLRPVIAMRWILIPVYLGGSALLVIGIAPRLGTEIFPRANTDQFALRFRATAGTRVEKTEEYAKAVLSLIEREVGKDKIKLTMGLVGVHAANYPVNLIHLWNGGPEEGWLAVQLQRGAGVNVFSLQEKLRDVLKREMPQLRVSFEPSDITTRVMSFGAPTPIEIAVGGADLQVSKAHAEKILTEMRKVPELRDVQIAQETEFPSVKIEVDRERAGLLGVNMQDVARAMVAATTSSRFTQANFWADPSKGVSYNVQVQIPQADTKTLEDLGNIDVASSSGQPVALRHFAKISNATSVSQFERFNMARLISVTANYHATDYGTAMKKVRAAIAAAGAPPPKTSIELRGQAPTMDALEKGFRQGLAIAVLVLFFLLAAYFQSWRMALIAISTVPAVLLGVVVMLWLTGTTLNIQSAIGSIMAIGVALANAILLVTFAERERRANEGDPRMGARLGASSRLRPIMMTSMAMIAGMIPMALGAGEGGEQIAPLGRAVVGGLVFATAATLLLLPACFALFAGKNTDSLSLDPDDETSVHYHPSTSV
ncbi:MAG: Multidrug resistance protein MdtC [Verrucomicrobiota bacterium]|jgi:multidrug efflux pump subunit AcrB